MNDNSQCVVVSIRLKFVVGNIAFVLFGVLKCTYRGLLFVIQPLRSTLTVQWMQDDCECLLFIHCTTRNSYRERALQDACYSILCSAVLCVCAQYDRNIQKTTNESNGKAYKFEPTTNDRFDSSLYSVRLCSSGWQYGTVYAQFDRIIVLV